MKNLTARIIKCATAAVLAAGLSSPAVAQDKSTWQRVLETKVMRLGAPISEPWYFKDPTNSDKPGAVKIGDTTWRGVGPVIAKELADGLGVELQIVETTWGNAIAGLQANQFDMMIGLDASPKRAAAIDFVPAPLFWYGTALAARPNVDIDTWKGIDDSKLKIGVPVGTSMELEIVKRAPNAQLSRFQNFNEMIAAFQSGRVDAITGSLTSATLASGRLPGTRVKMPQPAAIYPAGTGIRQEVDQRWKSYLATSIQYLANNGVVQQALSDVYTFRGIDISKTESVINK